MATLVMLELAKGETGLVPPQFESVLRHQGASRVQDTLSLLVVDLSVEEIKELCGSYPLRVGIGGEMIWQIFPEYRPNFHATVDRMSLSGPKKVELRLGDAIGGDQLVGGAVTLYNQFWSISKPPFSTGENVSVQNVDFSDYEHLLQLEASPSMKLAGKELFFCRVFSVVGLSGRELVPGVHFLSSRAIIENTDLPDVFNALRETDERRNAQLAASGFSGFSTVPSLRDDASGVLVVEPSLLLADGGSYGDALVSRILAAAALSSGVSGQITERLRVDANSQSYQGRAGEQWGRPYHVTSLPWQNVIHSSNPTFVRILQIIASSSEAKFTAAKEEDFRLLAIDTVEDSRRSGVAVLQMAQMWMAIERLLSFKTETASSVSLALSALYPADRRVQAFKELKKSYDLRSRVVHGYSFKRDQAIFPQISLLAQAFRRVFLLSMAAGIHSDADLREALTNHVLSGQQNAIDKDAGVSH